MNVIIWVLTTILGTFFLFSSTMKIYGIPKKMFQMQKEMFFDTFGMGRKQIRAIGFGEFLGGISVWFWILYKPLALIGLIGLMFITSGAIYYHWRFSKPALQMSMLAIIMFFLSGITLYLHLF